MTTVVNFSLDATFTQMTIHFTAGSGYVCTDLQLYIGSDYLTLENAIDLTANVGLAETTNFILTPDSPEIADVYTKDVFDGIFTIVITTDENAVKTGASLLNAFYASIALANKILAVDSKDKWNETNMLFLYLQAAITYMAANYIEQALGAYEKVEAIVLAAGNDYLITDVLPCGPGAGCWIVDGVYVIK